MVDLLSLALTHALMALAAWRLLLRDDLDRDPRLAEADPGAIDAHPAGPAPVAPLAAGPAPDSGVPRLRRLDRGARDRA